MPINVERKCSITLVDSNGTWLRKHQITKIHASREGLWEFCGRCQKGQWKIDLRELRAEIRALGGNPDGTVLSKGFWG